MTSIPNILKDCRSQMEKAVEAVNPDAGFLAKTVAAVAGFEGVKKVSEKLQENSDEKADASEDTATDSNS